jgi:hypothetical protein
LVKMPPVQKKKNTELEGPPVPVKVEGQRGQEIKHAVPSKVETGDPFLENMKAEFTYLGFEGPEQVLGGRIGYDGEMVDLELGAGMLNLAERKPLLYISPSIEVNGTPGRFDIYGNIHTVMIPGNEDLEAVTTLYANAGAVWKVSESGPRTIGFSLGIGLDAEVDFGQRSMAIDRRGGEIGAALEYKNLTFYAIEEIMFRETGIRGAGWDTLAPQHRKLKGGFLLRLEGAEMNMQAFYNQVESGGMIAISADAGKFIPEFYGSVSHGRLPILGDEVRVGARIRFGGKKKQVGINVAQGMGKGLGIGPAKKLTLSDNEEASKAFEEHFSNSETLDAFLESYSGESVENVLYAAQKLGKIAYETTDEKIWKEIIKKTAFSQEYADAMSLTDEKLYEGLRELLLEGSTSQARSWACTAISSLQARLFRMRGMETYLFSTTLQGQSHMAVITQDPKTKEAYLITWNKMFTSKNGAVGPLLEAFATDDRSIIRGIYIYGENNKLINYYETSEGKLMREAAAAGKDPLEERLKRRKRK